MNQVLWITGAGQGIGRSVALEYASRGWRVAISARTESDLDEVVNQAKEDKASGQIYAYALDVTDHDAVKRVFKTIEADQGPITQVIFNAGTHSPTSPEAFSVAPFRKLMEVNYMGAVNGLDAVLPTFIDRKTGHIAIVASVARSGRVVGLKLS